MEGTLFANTNTCRTTQPSCLERFTLMSQLSHSFDHALSGEQMTLPFANKDNNAWLDVAAFSTDFWSTKNQHAFFDMLVFNPSTSSLSINSSYQKHEQKQQQYSGSGYKWERWSTASFPHWFHHLRRDEADCAQIAYKRSTSMIALDWQINHIQASWMIRCTNKDFYSIGQQLPLEPLHNFHE